MPATIHSVAITAEPAAQRIRPPRGFTLIELVVVIVLIGILAFVAMPKLNLLKVYDEVGYRDKVKATLEFARKSAVAQRRHVMVTTASNGLGVNVAGTAPESGFPASFPIALVLPGGSTNTIAPQSGSTVTLTASVTPLVFDALGRPLDNTGTALAGSATYTVTGSAAATITVEMETGYVH